MSSRWKAVLGVLLVFALGVAAGAVGSSILAKKKMNAFLQHPGIALMNAMEQSLTKGIDLDPNQSKQIRGYFTDNLQQHKQLQEQIQPEVRQLNMTTVQEIRAALHPDQQKVFDHNLEDMGKRFWNFTTNQDAGGSPP